MREILDEYFELVLRTIFGEIWEIAYGKFNKSKWSYFRKSFSKYDLFDSIQRIILYILVEVLQRWIW
jgi:hypothetical protein